jgi:hypothetical protein
MRSVEHVVDIAMIAEENALLVYDEKQTIGTVRGVSATMMKLPELIQ